ncbi:acyl-homoserine-lactone synthase [Pseudomonas sp. NPDC077649]|uniref:acyl-homoserine-lactone synthase n=1 Tax=Pseudomonas sp. NPDC077649 TaxID=3364423 RepID=UPI0037C77E74
MLISIERRNNINPQALNDMHKLRARVFKARKKWDLPLINGMEIDGYDALDPYYMIISRDAEQSYVCGCWRILPTTGPNMLAHTFPELLHGQPAPCSKSIWELSRFAIEAPHDNQFGFSQGTTQAIHAIVNFAIRRGVKQFVTVTTVGVEKMLIRLGLDINRFGPALQVGVERAVALRIDLNDRTVAMLESAVASLHQEVSPHVYS